MSLADIREQIKVILSGVAGIGVVHDYVRWAADWGAFLNLYRVQVDDNKSDINGWTITRVGTPETVFAQGNHNTRTHHFKIRGVYGLQDSAASEIVFQDLVEAICTAFRAKDTLNGTVWSCTPEENAPNGVAGIQVDVIEPRMFGNALCHYAELSLYAQVLT